MYRLIAKAKKSFFIICLIILGLSMACCDGNTPSSNQDDTGQTGTSSGTNNQGSQVDMVKVDEVIDAIDALPITITKDDIKQVKDAERMYKALSDLEKQEVSNYYVLEDDLETVKYLQGLDTTLLSEFDNIFAFLDESIPTSVDSLESEIDLPSSYTYKDDYKNYVYRISYSISDTSVISSSGEVKHYQTEREVTIIATIKCVYNSFEKTYTKKVTVERNANYMFDHKILVAYWYGRYQELTEEDYESIDIINYSFAQIARKDDGTWYISGRLDNINNFAKVKEKGIKICLSLGGWHDDRSFWDTYALAASSEESRVAVANAILEVMIRYNLDGVDMDWEYPNSKDRTNYTLLMRQIKETLKAHNKDYLITAAIPAGDWIGDRFDLKALNQELDFFYIMTYDLDDGMKCNHLSSLADAKEAKEFFESKGVDKEKIVIGSAFYGRIYEGVSDNGKGGLGVTASEKDETSFDDIKENYLSRIGNGVTKYYDEKEEAYYLYDSENSIFITYEDTESVTDKWNYVVASDIGGLMYWSYNEDKSNTLMKAINAAQKNK